MEMAHMMDADARILQSHYGQGSQRKPPPRFELMFAACA